MAKRKRASYAPELKAKVIQLVKDKVITVAQASSQYGIPTQTIYAWLPTNQMKKLNRTQLKAISEQRIPPRPHLSNVSRAIELKLVVSAMVDGFDNREFCELCRRHSVKASDVRQIVDWGNKYGGHGLDFTGSLEVLVSEQQLQIKELKDTVAELQAMVSEMAKTNERQTSALAQYAELFLLKKAHAIYKE